MKMVQGYPVHELANLFPAMTGDEYAALKTDIEAQGQLDPVPLWRENPGTAWQVLDGRHRLRACAELGMEPHYAELPDGTDPVQYVVAENLNRRHLSESQRAMIAAKVSEMSRRGGDRRSDHYDNCRNGFTQDEAADVFSVSVKTIQRGRKVLEQGDPVLVEAVVSGEVHVSDAATIVAKPAEVQRAAVERAMESDGKATVRQEAARVEREMERAEAVEKAVLTPCDDRFQLIHSTVADLYQHVEEGSVDAIVTDPPYSKEYLPCYSELAEFAVHALRPGGGLYVMTGQMFFPEAMNRLLVPGLSYRWMLSFCLPDGGAQWDGAQKVSTAWKPVVVFTREGMLPSQYAPDVLNAQSGRSQIDKELHGWGQNVGGFAQLLQGFVPPGSVIADPFLGSGTTLVAAKRLGVYTGIGADIDADEIAVTKVRLKDAA